MPPIADLIIRRLAMPDVSAVALFEREIALLSFPDDPVTDLEFYTGKIRQATKDPKSWPFVAEHEGRVVAWSWIGRRENFITRKLYADLRSVYVVPDYRRRGVGSLMLRFAIDHCRNNDCLLMVGRTAASNAAMQKALERAGFAPRHVVFECRIDSRDGD